jgi:hypothetical protein
LAAEIFVGHFCDLRPKFLSLGNTDIGRGKVSRKAPKNKVPKWSLAIPDVEVSDSILQLLCGASILSIAPSTVKLDTIKLGL